MGGDLQPRNRLLEGEGRRVAASGSPLRFAAEAPSTLPPGLYHLRVSLADDGGQAEAGDGAGVVEWFAVVPVGNESVLGRIFASRP